MGDYGGIGEAINAMFIAMFILIIIFVPLGIWKIIDIIIWLSKNLNISWG